MFENKFVNDLTIIKSDGSVILTKAIVAHEEVQRLDGFDSDVSNSFAFVLANKSLPNLLFLPNK